MINEQKYAELYAAARENGGLLTLAQAAAAGFSEAEQRRLVSAGAWLRAGRGIRLLAA